MSFIQTTKTALFYKKHAICCRWSSDVTYLFGFTEFVLDGTNALYLFDERPWLSAVPTNLARIKKLKIC